MPIREPEWFGHANAGGDARQSDDERSRHLLAHRHQANPLGAHQVLIEDHAHRKIQQPNLAHDAV